MITCAEAVRHLWAYLDESLGAADVERIEEHLGLCRQCCGELEFARILLAFLADHAGSDHVPAEVRTRMRAFLEDLEAGS